MKVSTEGSKENLSIEQLQWAVVQRQKLDTENTDDTQEVAKRIREVRRGGQYVFSTL